MGRECAAQAQLNLLEKAAARVGGMNCCGHGLIWSPRAGEKRGGIIGTPGSGLQPDGHPVDGANIGPIESNGFPIDPIAAFGNWILSQRKSRRISSRRQICARQKSRKD